MSRTEQAIWGYDVGIVLEKHENRSETAIGTKSLRLLPIGLICVGTLARLVLLIEALAQRVI